MKKDFTDRTTTPPQKGGGHHGHHNKPHYDPNWKRLAAKPVKTDKHDLGLNWLEFITFVIGGVIAIIVAWFSLFAAGNISREDFPMSLYPSRAQTVILLFTIVLFVYPMIKAIVRGVSARKDRSALLRVAVMIVMVIVVAVGLDNWFYVSYRTSVAVSLHGLVVVGVAALALHLVLAMALSSYKEDSAVVGDLKPEKARLEQQLADEQTKVAQTTKAATINGGQLANWATQLPAAEEVVTAATKAAEAAKEAVEQTDEFMAEAQVKEGLEEAENAIIAHGRRVTSLEAKSRAKPNDTSVAATLKAARAAKEAAETTVDECKIEHELASSTLKLSVAGQRFKAADAEVQSATAKLNKAIAGQQADERNFNDAQSADQSAITAFKQTKTELDELDETLRHVKSASSYRDVVFWSVGVPLGLFATAFFCYSAWYGWIAVEVAKVVV